MNYIHFSKQKITSAMKLTFKLLTFILSLMLKPPKIPNVKTICNAKQLFSELRESVQLINNQILQFYSSKQQIIKQFHCFSCQTLLLPYELI